MLPCSISSLPVSSPPTSSTVYLIVASFRAHPTLFSSCCAQGAVVDRFSPPRSWMPCFQFRFCHRAEQNSSSLLYVSDFPSVKETSFLPSTCPPRDGPERSVSAPQPDVWGQQEPQRQKVLFACARGSGSLQAAGGRTLQTQCERQSSSYRLILTGEPWSVPASLLTSPP